LASLNLKSICLPFEVISYIAMISVLAVLLILSVQLAPPLFDSYFMVEGHIYPIQVKSQSLNALKLATTENFIRNFFYDTILQSTYPVFAHYLEATAGSPMLICRAREIAIPRNNPKRRLYYSHEVFCQRPQGKWISHGYLVHKVTKILISGCGVIVVQDESGLMSCTLQDRLSLQPCSVISRLAYHNQAKLSDDGILSITRQIQFPNGDIAREIYHRNLKLAQQGARLASIEGVLHYHKSTTSVCVLLANQDIYCRPMPVIDEWIRVSFHGKYNKSIYSKVFWTSIKVFKSYYVFLQGIRRDTTESISAASNRWPSEPLTLRKAGSRFTVPQDLDDVILFQDPKNI
jgi:hypothetical protein